MSLHDTVLLKIKIYEVDWYPTIELLSADETMLINGWMHANSPISTAKVILHCFGRRACIGRNDLLNKLLQHPAFIADLHQLDEKATRIKVNDASAKTMQARYCFNNGLNWLHDAGLCYTDITNLPIPVEKLSRVGKEVLNVLKLQADFYAAIGFLAPNDRCCYASAAEEKLNCTLFGHPEWTEPKWLAEHLKWLSGVYKYSRCNASRVWGLSLDSNLFAMISSLHLVRSWKPQVDRWLAKNDADFRKLNKDS